MLLPALSRRAAWLGLAVLTTPLCAAVNDYVDEFSEAQPRYTNSTGFQLSHENGALRMRVNTAERWKGQYLGLGENKDFSAAPYLSVKIRTLQPCLLTAYFFNSTSGNWTQQVRLLPSEHFVEYFFDFSNVPAASRSSINGLQFTPNGNSNGYEGDIYFDDLRVGAAAVKLASQEAVPSLVLASGSTAQKIRVGGLRNATGVSVSGASNLVQNVQVSALSSYSIQGQTFQAVTITLDAKPGATGSGTLDLTAEPAGGYEANLQEVPLVIEADNPPTLDPLSDLEVPVGVPQTVRLTGLTDGDISREQALTITATSTVPGVVPSPLPAVTRSLGSPYADLSFTAAAAGQTQIDVLVTAAGGGTVTRSFPVTAFAVWNHPPTLDPLEDREIYVGQGNTLLPLTGLSDGDGGTQSLSFAVEAANPALFTSLQVIDGGAGKVLEITPNPDEQGTTTLTVTVTDNGAAAGNNGHQSLTRTFTVTTRVVLPESFSWDMTQQQDLWAANPSITVTFPKEGADTVLKGSFNSKSTWDGLDFLHPDIDMTNYPVVTFDFKADQAGQLKVFVWDNIVLTPEQEAVEGKHYNTGNTIIHSVPAGQWQTYTFDFRAAGAMTNNKGTPLNASWITHTLINYHNPTLGWPFTSVSGNYYIRNVRYGEAALPNVTPVCKIDPVADQWHFRNPGVQVLTLSGITSGGAGAPAVSLGSTNAALFTSLEASAPDAEGRSTLTYSLADAVGQATVTVTVSAPGSTSATATFLVAALEANAAAASTVTVDRGTAYQTLYGFGTFSNNAAWIDEYTGLMGGSAMRIGLIGNQLELVNDNNDPYVLNRAALNYGAFDFDYYRRLKEKGVETFILTSWSPPAWMKDNVCEGYGFASAEGNTDNTDNRLSYHQYEEFAESMVAAVRLFQEEAGITLAAIGLQNEPTFHEPYPSAILDPARFIQMIKVAGRRFQQEGITTRLYMPEQVFSQTSSMNQYIDAITADAEALQYCDIIATHGYAADGVGGGQPDFSAWSAMYTRSQKGSRPMELWMTETYPEYQNWSSALNYAMYLYGALEYGRINLWTSWSFDGQMRKDGLPTMSLYTTSQFFRYMRPGAVRVRTTEAVDNVFATSCVNSAAKGSSLVTVLVNQGNTERIVKLAVTGGTLPPALAVSRTDQKSKHVLLGTIAGTDLVILPPQSVTSLVGQSQVSTNHPPTLADNLAASALQNAATRCTLSLRPQDEDGDPLTITWTVVSSPAGATPTFGSGGSTAAVSGALAENVVTFPAAGSYTFRALVGDGQANLPSAEVSVVVPANATTLSVAPATADLFTGRTLALSATVQDQFANALAEAAVQWTTTAGILTQSAGLNTSLQAPAEAATVTVTGTLGALSDTCVISVTVPPAGPTVDIDTLLDGRVGRSWISNLRYTSPNGTASWSVSAGALPPGLALNVAAGQLAGTPTQAGFYTFSLRITDNLTLYAEKSFTLGIAAAQTEVLWDFSKLPVRTFYGWMEDWVGWVYYYPTWYPWTYHMQHGWIYPAGTDAATVWFYGDGLGWSWTGQTTYPYLYSTQEGAWLFYEVGTSNPRRFWNVSVDPAQLREIP